jgi:cytochrome c5
MKTLFIVLFLATAPMAAAQVAATLYQQACATCHDTGANRAPARDTLRQMSPDRVRYRQEIQRATQHNAIRKSDVLRCTA